MYVCIFIELISYFVKLLRHLRSVYQLNPPICVVLAV